eukprot:13817239-Ditylum_brightwellii.AAC.1
MKYIQQRREWSGVQVEHVDWETFRIARKHNNYRNNQIVKLLHGILPMNKELCHYKQCSTDECLLYHTATETRNHLMQYQSDTGHSWQKLLFQELSKLLVQLHTKPLITSTLMPCIHIAMGDQGETDKVDKNC